MALKAIAANPSIPITPLTIRMNGEIFSCLFRLFHANYEWPLRVSRSHPTSKFLDGRIWPEAEAGIALLSLLI